MASKEQVLILDETEAALFRKLVCERLARPEWNLRDEEEWCEILMLKALEEKLDSYLDEGLGDDVIERGDTA